jgi:hypothetical protein
MKPIKKIVLAVLLISFLALCVSAAQEPPAEEPPANVAGNWAVYTKSEDGNTSTKSVELKQNGTQLTGHFKGPNQSGGIEGTINGRHIIFHTKTRAVLTFRGQVDGDSMHGNFGVHGEHINMHGEWEARRSE